MQPHPASVVTPRPPTADSPKVRRMADQVELPSESTVDESGMARLGLPLPSLDSGGGPELLPAAGDWKYSPASPALAAACRLAIPLRYVIHGSPCSASCSWAEGNATGRGRHW